MQRMSDGEALCKLDVMEAKFRLGIHHFDSGAREKAFSLYRSVIVMHEQLSEDELSRGCDRF